MQRAQSGEYILRKKQTQLYATLKQNAANFQTVNPVKKDGRRYNRFTYITLPAPCTPTGCTGGQMTWAASYAMRLDLKEGKQQCSPGPCTPGVFA